MLKQLHNSNAHITALQVVEGITGEQFKADMIKYLKEKDAKTFIESVNDSDKNPNKKKPQFGQSFMGNTLEDIKPVKNFVPVVQFDPVKLKKKLTKQQFFITQLAGSEQPRSGIYNKFSKKGKYNCIICTENLFSSEHKYKSKTGFAAFHTAIGNIYEQKLEVGDITSAKCHNCGSHLGDVVTNDKANTFTKKSYLINSVSLDFENEKKYIP